MNCFLSHKRLIATQSESLHSIQKNDRKVGFNLAGEKILVVDDETEISDLIALYLSKNGYCVITAGTGKTALDLVVEHNPDLIVLDIFLPDIDGLELCQEIRKNSEKPIIFLSCKSDEADKILGLAVGGDDYVTKPFSPGELIARIKAHLRRNRILSIQKKQKSDVLEYPGLVIDFSSHNVIVNDKSLLLSSKEFDILVLLAQNPNVVFSLGQIYDSIWGVDNIGDTRTVMVHMSNLRKKIEIDPSDPKYIVTIKGVGYKFNSSYND